MVVYDHIQYRSNKTSHGLLMGGPGGPFNLGVPQFLPACLCSTVPGGLQSHRLTHMALLYLNPHTQTTKQCFFVVQSSHCTWTRFCVLWSHLLVEQGSRLGCLNRSQDSCRSALPLTGREVVLPKRPPRHVSLTKRHRHPPFTSFILKNDYF